MYIVCVALFFVFKVWNRRKQEWMEVDDTEPSTPQTASRGGSSSPISNMLSSNAYASGVDQNSGNFLTGKPITRIHAPPGGASTISFGDQYTAPPPPKQQPGLVLGTPTQPATPESADSVEDGPAPIPMMELPPAPSAVEVEVLPPAAPVEAVAAAPAMSANAYATGSNQNSGNFMTGRPTTRVRAPPGGVSSITFG